MPGLPDDGRVDVEALIVDRYLDALLAGDEGTRDGETGATDRAHDAVDPVTREAAHVLRRSLVRVHPSFQFEERLSVRLAVMAAGRGDGSRLGAVIPFHPLRRAQSDAGPAGDNPVGDDVTAASRDVPAGRRSAAVRPLLIGGAITSAALSLAGVAWVARRAVRTPTLAELDGML